MPQFDFANVLVPQLVWLGIFFAILYFGIVQLTLPKLGKTIDARERKVAGDIAAAEDAKATADKLAADYKAGLDEAHRSARETIAKAQAKATSAVDSELASGNVVLAEKAAAADARLMAARSSALAEIEGVAASAAADIVERLTGKRPASGALSKAVSTTAAAN